MALYRKRFFEGLVRKISLLNVDQNGVRLSRNRAVACGRKCGLWAAHDQAGSRCATDAKELDDAQPSWHPASRAQIDIIGLAGWMSGYMAALAAGIAATNV